MSESEPDQDRVKNMVNIYGQVRTQVLELKRQRAMHRADLSNRHRVGKKNPEDDYVLVRDNTTLASVTEMERRDRSTQSESCKFRVDMSITNA